MVTGYTARAGHSVISHHLYHLYSCRSPRKPSRCQQTFIRPCSVLHLPSGSVRSTDMKSIISFNHICGWELAPFAFYYNIMITFLERRPWGVSVRKMCVLAFANSWARERKMETLKNFQFKFKYLCFRGMKFFLLGILMTTPYSHQTSVIREKLHNAIHNKEKWLKIIVLKIHLYIWRNQSELYEWMDENSAEYCYHIANRSSIDPV